MVDDEEFCLTTLKSILFSIGFDTEHRVDFCINGLEALNQLKKVYGQRNSYKMILTDFNMPVMNGIESTEKIRAFLEDELGI